MLPKLVWITIWKKDKKHQRKGAEIGFALNNTKMISNTMSKQFISQFINK